MSKKKDAVDGPTLEMLLGVYDKGMRVEAVDVVGVDAGTTGVVRYVLENGNLSVCWQNGDETQVRFGRGDIVKIVRENVVCMLGLKRGTKKDECMDDCSRCGWNPKIEKIRRMAIQAGEMRVNGNGVRGLVLNREGIVD